MTSIQAVPIPGTSAGAAQTLRCGPYGARGAGRRPSRHLGGCFGVGPQGLEGQKELEECPNVLVQLCRLPPDE